MKVYLAGPITGLDYDGAQGWRTAMTAALADVGITSYSPLRMQEYLRDEGTIDNGGPASSYRGRHPLTEQAGIVARDRHDVESADMVLVNLLGTVKASIGTVMEIAWADAYRVPCVVALEEGNVHEHAMVLGTAGFVVRDLDAALECVKGVLLP